MSDQSAKFKAWQSVDCAWCDNKATGNALHVYDGQWFASCGKHGRKYEPFGDAA
jgi:uncharacterized protein YfaT (DUF1175 family)